MKPVADTHHLQRRGDTWHFYRRVPRQLVPVLGRQFVKKSLGVATLAEAKKLRAIEEVRTNALFEAAEKGLAGQGAGTAAQPVSMDVLNEYVRETVEKLDKRAAERLIEDPPADKEELAEMRSNTELDLQALRDPSDPNAQTHIQNVARRVAADKGVDIERPDFPTWQFFELLRRGLMEVDQRKIARYSDDHSRPFFDNLFDPKRTPVVSFGALCDLFIAEQMQSYAANGVAEKRADSVKSKVATLREIVGEDRPVHEIDDDVVSHVRTTLAKVPNHRTIVFKKLNLVQAIEQAAKDGRPTLHPKSQAASLDLLKLILRLGVRKKYISGNPAEGVKPLVKDPVKAGNLRKPFTEEQVAKFFGSDFYASCAPNAAKPYSKPDRSWRFWLPLIMAFSGARPNEICSLTAADFGVTKAGTRYFAVTDEGEGKSVKTETSRRKVPVHPELERIGLLQFVEERRKADGDDARLFPTLSAGTYGGYSWYPSRRFNDIWLPAEIDLQPRQTLYSFRHSVRDALRRSKAGPDSLLHVCGWAPAGKAASDAYGDAGNPDLHAEAVASIAYAGVDLSFLHLESK